MNTLCFFENIDRDLLYPLHLLRPAHELQCGPYHIGSFIAQRLGISTYYSIHRAYLNPIYPPIHQTDGFNQTPILFWDSQFVPEAMVDIRANSLFYHKDKLVGFTQMLDQVLSKDPNLETPKQTAEVLNQPHPHIVELDGTYITTPHTLRQLIPIVVQSAFELITNRSMERHSLTSIRPAAKADQYPSNPLYELPKYDTLGSPALIYIHPEAKILPQTIFDTRAGPIIIAKNSTIGPSVYLQGPCYIGDECLVEFARVRDGSVFGKKNKIAGEISNSVFFSYTNKHHDGFIGHTVAGEFVNFGAMATNSDLKNTYSPVSISQRKKITELDDLFVGSLIGDHTKLGIGSLITTGGVIGIGCNLFHGGNFLPKEVPSFIWGGGATWTSHQMSKFMETTQMAMGRRQLTITAELHAVFEHLHNEALSEQTVFLRKLKRRS